MTSVTSVSLDQGPGRDGSGTLCHNVPLYDVCGRQANERQETLSVHIYFRSNKLHQREIVLYFFPSVFQFCLFSDYLWDSEEGNLVINWKIVRRLARGEKNIKSVASWQAADNNYQQGIGDTDPFGGNRTTRTLNDALITLCQGQSLPLPPRNQRNSAADTYAKVRWLKLWTGLPSLSTTSSGTSQQTESATEVVAFRSVSRGRYRRNISTILSEAFKAGWRLLPTG
jgi:hypothetical protein